MINAIITRKTPVCPCKPGENGYIETKERRMTLARLDSEGRITNITNPEAIPWSHTSYEIEKQFKTHGAAFINGITLEENKENVKLLAWIGKHCTAIILENIDGYMLVPKGKVRQQ